MAVVALDNMLAAYYKGKQIDPHWVSCQKKDLVAKAQHYSGLPLKQSFDTPDTLLDGSNYQPCLSLGAFKALEGFPAA